MIEKDLPITSAANDVLGRDRLAKQLAVMIEAYAKEQDKKGTKEGIVIGIEGPWGSGKTSLFNLIERHLSQELFSVRKFNSWMAIDKSSLIQLFFDEMAAGAKEQHNDDWEHKVMAMGQNVLFHVRSYAPLIQIAGEMAGLGGITETAISGIKKLTEEEPLTKQKAALIKEFAERNQWMLFFIDDIDRLSDEEIGLTFQLVKNIVDFPKIIYVLAYDKEAVSTALDKVQRQRGEEYIQKVVQLPVSIPEPEKDKIGAFLVNKINQLLLNRTEGSIDQEHFGRLLEILQICYIQTIRDCDRIYNAFSVKYDACGDDCDVGDLLAITVLELYDPQLTQFILHHKNALLARHREAIGMEADPKELKLVARQIEANEKFDALQQELLAELFPAFAQAVNWRKFSYEANEIISQRVCEPEYFDRYFQLVIPSTEISHNEVIQLLTKVDRSGLEYTFQTMQGSGQLQSFFRQGKKFCENGGSIGASIDLNRAMIILEGLSCLRWRKQERHGLYPLEQQMESFIDSLVERVVTAGEEVWDENALKDFFCNDRISISIRYELLRQCSRGQDWIYGGVIRQWHSVLSREAFERLEAIFIQQVLNAMRKPIDFLREANIRNILYCWEAYCRREGRNDYSEFLYAQEDDIPALLLAEAWIQTALCSGRETYWAWRFVSGAELVTKDQALPERVRRIFQSDAVKQLTIEEQESAAAYLLLIEKMKNENRDADDRDLEVTEKDVRNKLQELYGKI